MLQKRLQIPETENRIRSSQYGFRPKRNTVQAISIVRRIFDAAYASKNSVVLALLLDWAEAFDRLKPDVLIQALKRFGIPAPMVDMIEGIYSERCFSIRDPCGNSSVRLQRASIAQGCTHPPYLFI